MFKVRWSDGTTYQTSDEDAAYSLFDGAQGKADLFVLSSVTGHWAMIADGYDLVMGYDN